MGFLILFVSIFITYHNLCYRACHQHIAACRIFIVKINKGDKDILGQIYISESIINMHFNQ